MMTIDMIIQIATTLLGGSLALYVVLQPHPVLAVMALILLAFTTAIRWWTFKAFFFSLILLLIYLGAVLVLFLFVVMTLSQQHKFLDFSKRSWLRYLGLLCILALAAGVFTLRQPEGWMGLSQELSAQTVASVLLKNSEVLLQFLGLFLLLVLLIAVMLLSPESQSPKKDLI